MARCWCQVPPGWPNLQTSCGGRNEDMVQVARSSGPLAALTCLAPYSASAKTDAAFQCQHRSDIGLGLRHMGPEAFVQVSAAAQTVGSHSDRIC